MKRIPKAIRRKFKMPHLFLEDIENIEKIIVDELKPRNYKIEFGGFEYENIREISENINRTQEFHINTHDPCISIDLECDDAILYTSEGEIKTLGAIEKISNVILKRERKLFYYIIPILRNLFSISILIIIIITFEASSLGEKLLLVISWFFLYLITFFLWIMIKIRYKISLYDFSIVEFTNKKDRPNFLSRNKDQIVLGIFLVFLGIVLTKLFL